MKTLLPLLLLAAAPAFAAPAVCRDAADQLSEYLASAKQRIDRDGEVRVDFEVDASGRARALSLDGSRPYRTPVRLAISSLDCERGTPQRYVATIRFADAAPRSMAAASATLAEVRPAMPDTPLR